MARLEKLDPTLVAHLEALECHRYDDEPWVTGPPLSARRVAIISTAGLMRRGDRPFDVGDAGY
ncbi:MAG: selenoprotein B, partial [Gammaproteobacteria bacterium]